MCVSEQLSLSKHSRGETIDALICIMSAFTDTKHFNSFLKLEFQNRERSEGGPRGIMVSGRTFFEFGAILKKIATWLACNILTVIIPSFPFSFCVMPIFGPSHLGLQDTTILRTHTSSRITSMWKREKKGKTNKEKRGTVHKKEPADIFCVVSQKGAFSLLLPGFRQIAG